MYSSFKQYEVNNVSCNAYWVCDQEFHDFKARRVAQSFEHPYETRLIFA